MEEENVSSTTIPEMGDEREIESEVSESDIRSVLRFNVVSEEELESENGSADMSSLEIYEIDNGNEVGDEDV